MVARLHEALEQVCPIATARVIRDGVGGFDPAPEATPQQITAAEAALAAFDWSAGAHEAWMRTKRRARAKELFADVAEAQALIRAVALVLLDEINSLRAQHGLAARTKPQLVAAVRSKLDAADAD